MRMADVITEMNALAANITLSHIAPPNLNLFRNKSHISRFLRILQAKNERNLNLL